MIDPSWLGVAGVLCLLLGVLVWGAQRLLNTFHPWQDFRQAQQVPLPLLLRLVLLLLLWLGVATVVAALPFSYLLSLQGWTQQLSSSALSWMLSVSILVSGALIAVAAGRSALRWGRRHRRGVAASLRRRMP